MRLVVDTNLLISGTLWHGLPARLVDAALAVPGTLCFSPETLAEFAEVLNRPRFAARLAATGLSPVEIVDRFEYLGRRAVAAPLAAPADLRDPADLLLLTAAVGANAHAIVTGDQDLLVLRRFAGIPIIPAKEVLAWLEAENPDAERRLAAGAL